MEKEIGKVTHFYTQLGVGIVKLSATLKKGDSIHIKGHTTDIAQVVESIQYDHNEIDEGQNGQEVGLKTSGPVRQGDKVLLSE